MKVTINKAGRIVVPKGYYKLDKRQKLRDGDMYAEHGSYSGWLPTGQMGDLVGTAVAGFFNDALYIRKLSKKQKRAVAVPVKEDDLVVRDKYKQVRIPKGYELIVPSKKTPTEVGDLFTTIKKSPVGTDTWSLTCQEGRVSKSRVVLYIRRVK